MIACVCEVGMWLYVLYCSDYIVCTVHDMEYMCIEYVLNSVCDVG